MPAGLASGADLDNVVAYVLSIQWLAAAGLRGPRGGR